MGLHILLKKVKFRSEAKTFHPLQSKLHFCKLKQTREKILLIAAIVEQVKLRSESRSNRFENTQVVIARRKKKTFSKRYNQEAYQSGSAAVLEPTK